MAVNSLDMITVGRTVRFKTVSPHDNVHWTGVVKAICDYQMASLYTDIDAYYADVQRTVRNLANKENLTYFIITVADEAETAHRAFAMEWVDLSTLEFIAENTYVDFRVYDVDTSKAKDILYDLTSKGYTVDMIMP